MLTNRISASSEITSAQPTKLRDLSLRGSHRFLLLCGLLLIGSGLFHAVVFLWSGGPWDGPLSWRKPIVFGLSFGITSVSIAYVATALRLRNVPSWLLLGALGVASAAETALITMQTWRGVPSHFNFATAFDTTVFISMGVLVAIVAGVLVVLTVLSFSAMRPVPPSIKVAIRLGMLLLSAGQVLGVLIITTGVQSAAMGDEAMVFGPDGVVLGSAGILKYPHGIAMHAIQVLPVIALLGLMTRWNEQHRVWTVAAACGGYMLITAVSTVQAYSGRGGLMFSWLEIVAVIGGFAVLLRAGLVTVFAADWRSLTALRQV